MKRLIHATLALSLSISASAKSQTRTPHPYVEDPQTISISIEDISTGNDTTTLKIHAYCPPGNWIRMSRDTYLDADGKRYPLIGSKGIAPGEKLQMGASGDSIFTMYFQALPATTVKFDLMEGTSNDDFKLIGIHTDRSFDTDRPTYDMSLLPVPKFEKGTFTLTGKIKNYDPAGEVTTVKVYPRCALGRRIKDDGNVGQINTDGTFSLSIEINQNPQPCFISLPGYYGLAYFTPGEEATIEIDAAKRWHNGFHGERGSVEFGGTYGDINDELATIYGHDMVWDSFANNMPRGKKYTDVEAIKDDILRHRGHRIAKLHHLPLSDKAKALFKIGIDLDIINQLNYTPFVMRIQGIPASYYTYYKELGFDDPMMMWSSDYDSAIGNLSIISVGQNSAKLNVPPASHYQKLIDSGSLTEDEANLARTLIKYCPENIPADINDARVRDVTQRFILLADTAQLQDSDRKRAINLINNIKSTDGISHIDAFNSLLSWAISLPQPNPIFSSGGLKDIYTDNLNKEEESFLKEKADALSAFYTRHGKDLQDLKFIHDIDESISKFRTITGIEDPTIEALMANHKYNSYIDSRNTLPEAYIADAKARLPQYIFDHLMDKNAEMGEILNKATFNILEVNPSDDCEKILADIAAKHKGKVLYIDIWAVWCGPCIHAISEIQPAKKDYADKVAFVYLADESSPKDTWSEKIKSIDGDHYRLSQAQMQSVMSRFGFDSYPSYIVIGKNGDISYSGFIHGLDSIKELLDRETNK